MKKKIIVRVLFLVIIVAAVAAAMFFSSDKSKATSSLTSETKSSSFSSLEANPFSFLPFETIASAQTTGYLGCFKDTSDFDLNGYLERSQSNTPQRCIGICLNKGFKYAGVQYGESCLCGNSYGKYGAANNCNMKCTGNSSQICGGINANSIYTADTGGGSSGWGPTNNQASLNGTNLTYYRGTTAEQCKADCNGNAKCKGFALIRAGYYNPNDPPMCYLVSEVTEVVPSACCISAVKTSGGGGGGGTLKGEWNLKCCNDELRWTLYITKQEGNTFSGSFSDNAGGGGVTNGQLRGYIIEFDRSGSGWTQHWTAQLVNDGGRLRMTNGVWTGAYLDRYPGRNNWHAEKK